MKLIKISAGMYAGLYKNVRFTVYSDVFDGRWTPEWRFTYETAIGVTESDDLFRTRTDAINACTSWIQFKLTSAPQLFVK